MITVELISGGSDSLKVTYVVIAAQYREGWLFVRHRRRGGFELPAGHSDDGEESLAAAVRELTEETGARDFIMEPVSYYSVDSGSGRQFGRLFYAEVQSLGEIVDTAEVARVRVFRRMPRKLSLPEVMSFLFRVARQHAG
ncbi:MAG: NUDIX domain-containing protein [Bacteroidales bacterium]|nr:NUDIX domain-containing protein [Bacteroidales bacterium]MDT8372542.1 NUDIX domain-containing protein [Bacteroidales bacterium]